MQLDEHFLNEVAEALQHTWENVDHSIVLGDEDEDELDAEDKAEFNTAAIEYCLESGAWELEFDGTVGELIRNAEEQHGFESVRKFIQNNVKLID